MNGSINAVYSRLEYRAKHHDARAALKEGEDRMYEESDAADCRNMMQLLLEADRELTLVHSELREARETIEWLESKSR